MKIINLLAETKIRLGRGQGLFYEAKNAGVIAAALKIMFELTVIESVIAGALALIAFFIAGALDYGYFKLAQKENELFSSKYNPHLDQISQITQKLK